MPQGATPALARPALSRDDSGESRLEADRAHEPLSRQLSQPAPIIILPQSSPRPARSRLASPSTDIPIQRMDTNESMIAQMSDPVSDDESEQVMPVAKQVSTLSERLRAASSGLTCTMIAAAQSLMQDM